MTGRDNYKTIKIESRAIIPDENKRKYYHPYPFIEEGEYKHAFAAADLVVTRAGSGTLFEIAANKRAALVIPIDGSAQNHQVKNAYAFEKSGGAEVIEQKNFTSGFFLERVRYLFSRPEILQQMSRNVYNFARPKSAKVIASYIVEYVKALK